MKRSEPKAAASHVRAFQGTSQTLKPRIISEVTRNSIYTLLQVPTLNARSERVPACSIAYEEQRNRREAGQGKLVTFSEVTLYISRSLPTKS